MKVRFSERAKDDALRRPSSSEGLSRCDPLRRRRIGCSAAFWVSDGSAAPSGRAAPILASENSMCLSLSCGLRRKACSCSLLLTPNGRAATAHDMQQAVDHLQAALTLDPSVHAGTIDVAQRLSFQRHLMICSEAETDAAAERGSSLIAASSRMGEPACAAYRQWTRLQPQHGEVKCRPRMPIGCIAYLARTLAPPRAACWQARAILHFDCGSRMVLPRPRIPEAPIEGLASMHELVTLPSRAQQAASLFARHGVAVFDGVLPADLCAALASELAINGSRQREVVNGKLRSDTVGDPNGASLRWNSAQSPGRGLVSALLRLVAQHLGAFLVAALGVRAGEVHLLECGSMVTYPGAPAQTWCAPPPPC